MVAGRLDFDGVFCVTGTLAGSACLVPSLSSVDPDRDAVAERAVALLLARIEQHQLPPRYEKFVSSSILAARGPRGAAEAWNRRRRTAVGGTCLVV